MYKNHASPLARIVRGIPDSWERVVATATFDEGLYDAVWSPCDRFIAVAGNKSVEVLDAVTLTRLSIFENSSYTARYLRRLCFSPDGRCLTLCVDRGLISWDPQTGSSLSTIPLRPERSGDEPFSFKHSKDGKVIAVAYKPQGIHGGDVGYSSLICTYDHHSGRHVGSHCFPEERIIDPIWTHDEYLQFATINPTSIRIWQCPFTLEPPPVEVAFLSAPDGIVDANRLLFLPSLSRLAFVLGNTIQVWNLKAPKLLLKSEVTPQFYKALPPQSSFSSDGHFFAYTTSNEGVYVWKDSPTGYLPYQWLSFFVDNSLVAPRLSQNTESMIVSLKSKIHRLHTRDQVPSFPSISTRDSRRSDFTLGFSPDQNFAAFTRRMENTVTIIDLKSGEPKWSTDVGLEIGCVGMAGGRAVIAVGKHSIVTWNLPGGDCTFNASIKDIVRTTILGYPGSFLHLGMPCHMSISPDLSRITVMRVTRGSDYSLEVDDVSTGWCLAGVNTRTPLRPHFTLDGREVWTRDYEYGVGEDCEIIEDSESGAVKLKVERAPGGIFKESPSGYAVTDSGWVLSPSSKPLLWLPHRWRSPRLWRTWGGRFLGLLHGELSEVVILEFLE